MGWLRPDRLLRERRWLAVGVGMLVLVAAGLGGTLLVSRQPSSPHPVAMTATPSRSPSPTTAHTASPTPERTASPTPVPAALQDGRLTVVVLGSDSDVARRARGKAFLTDAITVVSVKANGNNPVLLSLPRDTVDLPLPSGEIWTGKVNALATLRGPEVTVGAMELLLDLQIDHYVMVDMDDFRTLVDAVGGVTVNLPYGLYDGRCAIPAGRQHLDGAGALCFARHRSTDTDYARAARHQRLLLALRDAILSADVDVPALLVGLASLQTDMPLRDLPRYAALVRRSANARPQMLVLAPPTYTTFVGLAGARGWISVPNVPAIQDAVAELIRD